MSAAAGKIGSGLLVVSVTPGLKFTPLAPIMIFTSSVVTLPTARSSSPSPLKSAAAIPRGPVPAPIECWMAGLNVAAVGPVPNRTEIVSPVSLTTTKSVSVPAS